MPPQLAERLVGKTREEGFVPCRNACPAHVDVPRYLRFIKEGNYAAAAATVREKVPFPHALGYICVHNCETECKRTELNEPISIRNLKRYAAQHDDRAWKGKLFQKPPTGKKIAVVGAGPAGMTAAYYAARLGHQVNIFEARPAAGGQMRYGIPNYRLPREILDEEIRHILAQDGIEINYNTAVEHAPSLLQDGFDAVFVATGTHAGTKLPINGNDLAGVQVNADFLRDFEMGKAHVGKKVVILGGGNVAVDCAGAALRLGAESAVLACLEAYDQMTATKEERTWAEEEGVQIYNSKTFHEILDDGNGHCAGVRIQGIEKFYFDADRKAHMELAEGTEEILEADTVIFAVGQRPEISSDPQVFGLELTHGNYIQIKDDSGATSTRGIWAAGDAVTGTQSVIQAIASARKAVCAMDRYLGGDGDIEEALAPRQYKNPHIGAIRHFGDQERVQPRVVPVPERVASYRTCGPMDQGFDGTMAACEAGRCLQCDLRCELEPQKFWNDYMPDHEADQKAPDREEG